MPVENPTRVTPSTQPVTEPGRRLDPQRLCPAQKNRVTRRLHRELQP